MCVSRWCWMAKLGSARIRQELQGKGLDKDAVIDAVASLQATELDRARDIWNRKFGEVATDAKSRGQQRWVKGMKR